MKNDGKKFDPAKYGMIFCPECEGSGKSLGIGKETNVCAVCGGFGLIKTEEKNDPHANWHNQCLSETLQKDE